MTDHTSPQIKVECTECPFSEIIDGSDEELPANAVIEHGKETGHTLRVEAQE